MATSKICITTIGGHSFDPLAPELGDIDINDIAHSLSLICRANGHFSEFYSVARHCLNCAREAEARGMGARMRLLCLLHDATEAYIGDMTRPLKRRRPTTAHVSSGFMSGFWNGSAFRAKQAVRRRQSGTSTTACFIMNSCSTTETGCMMLRRRYT